MRKLHELRYCPECHVDLRGESIPEKYIKAGYYQLGETHFSRLIGIEDPMIYDGICCWMCPDCGYVWLRDGLERKVSKEMLRSLKEMGRLSAEERDRDNSDRGF